MQDKQNTPFAYHEVELVERRTEIGTRTQPIHF